MRPNNLKTKIFLDSGDPNETKKVIDSLGFLDGQTTNPSYFVKSPHVQNSFKEKGGFTQDEIINLYEQTIKDIGKMIPEGSVSIEVYADKNTTAEEMMEQARSMNKWIPNAHIKFPITSGGLKAANMAIAEGMRVNMTVCFSQEQAAAVYAATKGAKKGDVFISPFMGRLFDKGMNGLDLVKNILKMYSEGDGHVMVLAASLRSLQQFYAAIALGSDIITSSITYLEEWKTDGIKVPDSNFIYQQDNIEQIPYQEISLDKDFAEYNINNEFTDIALQKFADDWNGLIKQ